MGSIYTVKAWVKFDEAHGYQWNTIHQGQKFLPALWALYINRHKYGCVALEVRMPK